MRDSPRPRLEGFASAVASRARWVTLAALVLAAASAAVAVRELRVQVDTVAMFRTDLPHLQRWFDFAERHPLLAEPLVVVVDAPAGRAAEAAAALADAMRAERESFSQVHAPGAESFFQRHGLLYRSADDLAELGDRLAAAQPMLAALDRDPNLPGLFGLLDQALAWRDRVPASELQPLLVGIGAEVDAATRPEPVGRSLADRVFGEASVDESERAVLLALPKAGRDGINPVRGAIDGIKALADELGLDAEAGYRVRITGDLALSADELQLLNENAVVTGIAAFVLVSLILMAGLRNLRLVCVLCLTLLTGLLWTAGFAALAVGRLNMISIAFAVMSIGLGIDFGIHLGVRYRELAERGRPGPSALRTAVGDTGSSLLLCALTTAVGFYAFLPTDFAGLAEFGLISGSGILLSLLATLVVFPALIVVVRPRFPLRRPRSSKLFASVVALPKRRPTAVLTGAACLTVVAVATLPGLRFSGNPLDLRVPDSESASAFRELLADDDDSTWNLQVIGRTPEQARRLAAELSALEVVARATTTSDLVPGDQEVKLGLLEDISLLLGPMTLERRGGDPATPAERVTALASFASDLECDGETHQRDYLVASACGLRASIQRLFHSLPDDASRDAVLARLERRLLDPIAQRLASLRRALEAEPVTLASLPDALIDLWQARDGTWRVEVVPAGSLDSDAELAAFVGAVRERAPDVTGMAVNVVEADRLVVESLRLAFTLAAVAIALILAALWRRPGDVLRALLPIAMSAFWILGAATWLGMPLNFANVIVLPLILGIGIDSGVHMVERHRRDGAGVDLLRSSTARAILLSSCTTLASFGSLAFSPHPGMASMGRLLVIGVAFTLLANLLVLPALLSRASARSAHAPRADAPLPASARSVLPRH